MPIYGSNTILPIQTGQSAECGVYGPFSVTAGQIVEFGFYIGTNAGATSIRVGVYEDDSGYPGDLIASADLAISGAGWKTIDLTNNPNFWLPTGSYYIAAVPLNSTVTSHVQVPTANEVYGSNTTNTMPDPFTASVTPNSANISIYIDVDESMGQPLSINVNESVSVVESATSVIGALLISAFSSVSIGEAATITPQTPVADLNINVSDTISITESVQTSNNLGVSVSDSVNTQDVVNPSSDNNINVNDNTSITEVVQLSNDLRLIISDNVAVAEVVQISDNDLAVAVEDNVSVVEDLTVNNGDLGVSVSEEISITESTEPENAEEKIIANDDVSVSEDMSAMVDENISVSDLISINEYTDIFFDTIHITVNDDISITESISIILPIDGELSINVSDDVSISENVSISESDHQISVSDEITIDESGETDQGEISLSVSDNVSITENIDLSVPDGIIIQVFETVTITDSAQTENIIINIDAADSVSISENLVSDPGDLGVSVDDAVTVSENLSIGLNTTADLNIDVSDSVTVQDAVTTLIEARTNISYIGTGRDYETVQDWFDNVKADLTASCVIELGILTDNKVYTTGAVNEVAIYNPGQSSNEHYYYHLKAADDVKHTGQMNTGARITKNSGGGAGTTLTVIEQHFKIEDVELICISTSVSAEVANVQIGGYLDINSCIIHPIRNLSEDIRTNSTGYGIRAYCLNGIEGLKVRNSIIFGHRFEDNPSGTYYGIRLQDFNGFVEGSDIEIVNNTFFGSLGLNIYNWTGLVLGTVYKNNLIFVKDLGIQISIPSVIDDYDYLHVDANVPTYAFGPNSLYNVPTTIFVDPDNYDLRLKGNHAAVTSAEDLSSLFSDDITGTNRTLFAYWSPGAFQLLSYYYRVTIKKGQALIKIHTTKTKKLIKHSFVGIKKLVKTMIEKGKLS